MQLAFQTLTASGPTPYSPFRGLPFDRDVPPRGSRFVRPILAYRSESCIKIIGDIHRFEQAQDEGKSSLPAFVISDVAGSLDLCLAVAEYYAPMNLMDQVMLIQAAGYIGLPDEDLIETLLPIMNLPPQRKFLDQLKDLAALKRPLQELIHQKALSLKRCRTFLRTADIQDWILLLLECCQPGINVLTEILQHIWEIGQRDALANQEILESYHLHEGLPDIPLQQRLATIRETLQRARFPVLSESNDRLSQSVAELNLSGNLQLRWDPRFEAQGLELIARLRNVDQAEQLRELLADKAFRDLFERI